MYALPPLIQQKFTDIHMLIPVPAKIEFVKRQDIFGIIIINAPECTKLPPYRFFRRKKICHLIIFPLAIFLSDKIYLKRIVFTDADSIPPP